MEGRNNSLDSVGVSNASGVPESKQPIVDPAKYIDHERLGRFQMSTGLVGQEITKVLDDLRHEWLEQELT